MSEYQYYEFQALDRPLAQREMRELRKYSTRATITDTRFVNHYEWGNFKGDASVWMRKYFDAFLYCANWGTHRLMLRLPFPALDIKTAKRYLGGRSVSAHRKDNVVILDFAAEDEGGNWGADYDGTGLLSSLVALRADIAAGDHRALYLAWLSSAQIQEWGQENVTTLLQPRSAVLLDAEPSAPCVLPQISFSTATGGDFAMQAIIGSTLLSSKAAQPTKKPFEIYDSRLSGFTLRVQPRGVRSYYARFGRNRRVALGQAGTIEPDEARERCQKVLGNVAHGRHPLHGLGGTDGITLGTFIADTYTTWVKASRPRTATDTLEKLYRHFRTWYPEPLTAIRLNALNRGRRGV